MRCLDIIPAKIKFAKCLPDQKCFFGYIATNTVKYCISNSYEKQYFRETINVYRMGIISL